MASIHGDVNERMELRVTADLVGEFRPELAAFLGSLDLGRLLEEVFMPLTTAARTRVAVAYEERAWPPAGVGARALRGVALAVVSDDGQSLLTPVVLSPQHVTNVGLAAALTKILLEDLAADGTEWVTIFVNQRSKVVAGELMGAGFEPRAARVVTGETEFTAFASVPTGVLESLGLADTRLGDVLALNLDRAHISRLTAFHLSLAAGLTNYWADRARWAEVFPGFIDWATLPPGGITGTPGPAIDPVDPVVIVDR
ncbi:hypothetical protein I6A84_09425 [Frankia sp. CNm7]|uniref:Uncharacterized protein n=1 Tax=Frankia nepalensis TaxID=1836974 RepID=A0A937RI98_9ACTN|nr:hypothetical protein [Frankia nepalensis]MBL7497168.1 hypothetical protein [Frankia nepalensis]MBL7513110.1 hypothetical protein [Frankia nepalensis]MBL7518325.1 hypothetical protein [Frankia nepalensis]MBL7626873.1 hypothetical protein [Frankia nepalensis]